MTKTREHSLYQKKPGSVHSQKLSAAPHQHNIPDTNIARTALGGHSPGGVREAIRGGVVEDVPEPRVRVEREHAHVRVRGGERGGVGGERGVVVTDVLRVERGGGRGVGEVTWGALERGEVEEEVGAAEVVRVGGFLRVADTGHGPPRGWSARLHGGMALDTHDGTEQGLHFCFPERLEVELEME